MMTMYSLHSTPPQSPLSLTLSADNGCTTDVKMVIMWTVPTAVLSVRYHIGCYNEKKYPPIAILPNICKYYPISQCQYRSNPS